MGLELGHLLLLSNYHHHDKLALKYLTEAYALLERNEFIPIVYNHFEKKEEIWNKKQEEVRRKEDERLAQSIWLAQSQEAGPRYMTRYQAHSH